MPQNTENVRVHGPGHEKRDVNYRAVFIFGITLTLMSWLLVVSGVIVLGAEIGRILSPLGKPAPPPQR